MEFVWWLTLCSCVTSSIGQTTAAGGGATDGPQTTAASAAKGAVEGVVDFFPYQLPAEMLKRPLPVWDHTSYFRPGFASIYPPFTTDFQLVLHPPKSCQAIFLCFFQDPQRTSRGYARIDFKSACQDSLRFMVMEQIVYQFKGGTGTPYVYVKSLVHFRAVDNGNFKFEAQADFDGENVENATVTDVNLAIAGKHVLMLTSSPYCHAVLYHNDATVFSGEMLQIEPDTDVSSYYAVQNKPKLSSYVISGSMSGSTFKSNGPRSEMYDIIANQKIADDDHCCVRVTGPATTMKGEDWSPTTPKAVANSYNLYVDEEATCKRDKNAINSPLLSFVIEIKGICQWMRICFDKSDKKWCEHEGNILNLIFYHDVFIPTDTDQAQPLALGYGNVHSIRINFLFDEPAIEMAYVFAGTNNPTVFHTMHLKSYEEVGMNPSKLFLHVVKDGRCRARLTSDFSEDFANVSSDFQCLHVTGCECYKYD